MAKICHNTPGLPESSLRMMRAMSLIQGHIDLMAQQRDPNGFTMPCLSLDLAIAELRMASKTECRA